MNAYTLVDAPTRKKLDEMLKTWKEPVPGSLDSRPVFPVEITRSIENALIKARTAALQQQQARSQQEQLLNRGRGAATPPGWANTSTPSQPALRYPSSSNQNLPPQYSTNGQSYGYPSAVSDSFLPASLLDVFLISRQPEQYPPRCSQTPQQYPQPTSQSRQDAVDLGALHRDIEALISTARTDFANNPLDPSVQQRLKALLDLQAILQRQELPQDQLRLVRDQVSALAPSKATPQPTPTLPPSLPPAPPPAVSTPPTHSVPQQIQPPNLQWLNPGTLAELIKATGNRQQPTPPPQPPNPFPQVQPTTTPQPSSAAPATSDNPSSLIAALRARGLLPPATSTLQATPAFPNLPFILPGQVRYTPPVSTPQTSTPSDITISVQMSTASIKM